MKEKLFESRFTPEEGAAWNARSLDWLAGEVATKHRNLLGNLSRLNPGVKRAMLGAAGPEGVMEMIVQRADALRFGDVEGAPSIADALKAAFGEYRIPMPSNRRR